MPDTVETLREVNNNLRSALIRLHPEQKHCSTIRPQDFSDLRSEILRAGECLRQASLFSSPRSEAPLALEKESAEFRSNLEKLKYFLPDLHDRLLAEKARVETAKKHAVAAAAWAGASQKTV